ncbi:PTS sugar transporter subunit IIA [Paenibacillus sp. FSL R5-0490]|uniref:PTS sugar transporter subunit IIA n=1 Tax=Paenibacillus sp. FSL R5-0490 TaxID=1920424 RepID=UPI001589CA3F|nr:PTS sugar transporter subunit IIA [Paenibacillus sp. FSL R5-0490]
MHLSDLISSEFIFLNVSAYTNIEAISILADYLFNKKVVKASFKQAVLQREETSPTGLQTKSAGIAIPHTDIEHVNRNIIAIAVLKEPVYFCSMEDPQRKIETNLVFMLALQDPHGHLNVLKELIMVFQDEETLSHLISSSTPEELYGYLRNRS